MRTASPIRAAHFAAAATVAAFAAVAGVAWNVARAAEDVSPANSVDRYDRLLKLYVDDEGLVNYSALKLARTDLDGYVAELGATDPEAFKTWERDAQLAFWINAYNAITLKCILDHYPIARSGIVRAALYPANSIRQIDGVWTEITTPVLGQPMTLDHIEHEIIRKQFDEPRIHAAIVCAARGCPPLRAEAFRADTLDELLDDQCRRFLAVPHRFRIDRETATVHLSPILSWFSEDFVRRYGPFGRIGRHNAKDSAALHFVRQFVQPEDAAYLEAGAYRVEYLSYDWSLNEQQP